MPPTTPSAIKLHDFAASADCISRGGAAKRFGSTFTWFQEFDGIKRRDNFFTYNIDNNFSLEDQNSKDWILIEPKEWKEFLEREQKMYQEYFDGRR